MKHRVAIAASIAVVLLPGAALSQTVSDPSNATRLRLAKEILAANGGAQAMQAQLKSMFSTAADMVKQSTPAEEAALSNAMMGYLSDEEMKAVPAILEDTASAYAEHLTVTELRDLLAWSTSESGRSIRSKMPLITQEIMRRQEPEMKALMQGVISKSIERACEDTHCTEGQRRQIAEIVAKILGSPVPGNRPGGSSGG